jgi:hypothetical protein
MRLGFFSNIYRKYYGWRTGSSAAGGSGVLLLFGGRGDLCALRRGEKTTIVTRLDLRLPWPPSWRGPLRLEAFTN